MKAFASLALLASLGSAAFAQSYITTGSLTTSDPTFRRANSLTALVTATGFGSVAAYDTYQFTVSSTGIYTGELAASGTSALDTYLLVYSTFDPSNALTGLLNGDDDYTTGNAFSVLPGTSAGTFLSSRIFATDTSNYAPAAGLTLTAGVTYTAVVTSYYSNTNASGIGAYTLGLGGGPGTVSAVTTVPEPATMAALGLGAVALLKRRRKA